MNDSSTHISWFFYLLKWPLKLLTRFKAIADSHDEVPSQPDHVVYVMRSPSAADLVVARQAAKELNLPDPTSTFEVKGREFPRVLYVEDDRHRLEYDAIEPFSEILDLHNKFDDLNVLMFPVGMFWGREPGKDKRDSKTITADIDVPGKWKKFMLVLFSGRSVLVRVSRPVSLRKMADDFKGDKNLARKLKRVARTHFARLRHAVAGPKLTGRKEIIAELLRLPAIRKAILEEAKSKHISEEKAENVARQYLNEIAADYREGLVRFGDRFLSWLWTKIYRGISVKNSAEVRELAQDGHEIVYVPCHRSHMDYILLSYVIYKEGLVPPHIAAGVNLNFFPMGPIFRRGGAFFIRRSFRGNKLYSTVFREYLGRLFQKGYAIEYFMEGGRSRTGRLLAPKTGMLAMTLQGQLRGISRPISLVPVYVGYEHVMEVSTYHKELRGKNKEKESIFQVFGILKKLRNFGTGYVTFGQPLRLSDYLDNVVPDWRDSVTKGTEEPAKPRWLTPCVNQLAGLLMQRVNEGAAVNPINLAAMCLLATDRQRLSKDELMAQVSAYIKLQQEVKFSAWLQVPEADSDLEHMWNHLVEMNKFHVDKDDAGEVVRLDQVQALSMTYYRNNILHAFIIPALIARYARGHHNFTLDAVKTFVLKVYPMIQAELYMPHTQEQVELYVNALCEHFVSVGWFTETKDGYAIAQRDQNEYVQLVMLADAAGETLARYAVVLELLQHSSSLSRSDLEKFSETVAMRLGSRHGIDAPEFYDKKVFSTLVSTLKTEGYIVVAEDGSYVSDDRATVLSEEVDFLMGSAVQLTIKESTKRLLNDQAAPNAIKA
ncbi:MULTISPECIES: glycerol-3-phosphate 1-O-acyltransferase PlsB [Gammaproteobacteria]|uniref:glycerol-3-phosphate 1-O-acyltransferase PlsB n=1 Tax=Gammaproteobacteria TaxID=1236 RepID=UPI000DD0716E|nr:MULTISPECIES: glycerol-3-phosphate 1-O-acyltransferase PlsB [Gammaproteobacteria]RTE86472.1 glycerol-3-phosphate 1-O-acyltransferase [Aliidiomarina sp. B3213]TCZ90973.1 glycerol-3-phosphate 1-O-acyltransferase [Lysobacter sp. N42]